MNNQDAIRNKIIKYLNEKDIAYGHDDEKGYIVTDFVLDDGTELDFGIAVMDEAVVSYARLPIEIASDKMDKVCEYLHRANYGLLSGNFEIDFRERRVQYKTFFYVTDPKEMEEEIEALFITPFAVISRYKKGLLAINNGKSDNVERIISEIEG